MGSRRTALIARNRARYAAARFRNQWDGVPERRTAGAGATGFLADPAAVVTTTVLPPAVEVVAAVAVSNVAAVGVAPAVVAVVVVVAAAS